MISGQPAWLPARFILKHSILDLGGIFIISSAFHLSKSFDMTWIEFTLPYIRGIRYTVQIRANTINGMYIHV